MTLSRGLIILLLIPGLVASCTPEEQAVVTGVLVGGGLGYVIGHQSDHEVEGAIIGAVIGGMAGYIIGSSRSEPVADAEKTEEGMGYSDVRGLVLDIGGLETNPGTASPGEDMDLVTTVAVAAPERDEEVTLRQRIAIYRGEEEIGKTIEDRFSVLPGTHRIIRTISLQDKFEEGPYRFATHIRASTDDDVAEDYGETSFRVAS